MPAVRLTPLLRLAWWIHRWMLRLSGGRIGSRNNDMPVLLLTTRGRRSGEERTVALQFLRDGDSYVVIASFAGEDRHPAWWLNLQATADARVSIRGRQERVRASEALGEERDRLWRRIVEADPAYAEYEERTTRRIPVVILEPTR
ncbi:MAG: nitroreductase family deazaflavin-dependent oxidoreductase [Candidatus Limnocylindria bacterium]